MGCESFLAAIKADVPELRAHDDNPQEVAARKNLEHWRNITKLNGAWSTNTGAGAQAWKKACTKSPDLLAQYKVFIFLFSNIT